MGIGKVWRRKAANGRNSSAPMGPSRMLISKTRHCCNFRVCCRRRVGTRPPGRYPRRRLLRAAVFGVFCRRWGVRLVDGGTVRLPAIVGLGRALDVILTGRAVDAREALGMGLANYVVPMGKVVEKAWEIAEGLVRFPQGCMGADRRSVCYSVFEARGLGDALRYETEGAKGVVAKEGVLGAVEV